jgi:sulfide:quinone oxidoreductase
MQQHVVILGAGFGGLELASRLSESLADEVRVTLIDQSDSFVFGFSKLDVMFGRKTADQVRNYYRDIAKPSVEFRRETIRSIDPAAKRVVTDQGTYDADILVVALGADLDPAATPGLVADGYEFYSPAGATRAGEALESFTGGTVVIGVLGGFFKCPPAPNEAAFMLHEYLTVRGLRDATTIYLTSPMGSPIPISPTTSAAIVDMLHERDINYWPGALVTELNPATHVAHLADGREIPYDLFLAIPIHRAPPVVVDSGLTDDGWIAVNPQTFATKFPDVYAVGDVTSAPVPRAGVIAEGEARTVAEVLIERLGNGAPPAPFAGEVVCYIEMGRPGVGKVDVNFLSGPEPTALYQPPSSDLAKEKRRFGSTRRTRWFGAPPEADDA